MDNFLEFKKVFVEVAGKTVVRDFSLIVRPGEIHALMGPNGSGKSSIAYACMGHPEYRISGGEIFHGGENIVRHSTEERAKKGLFLSFQEPPEIGGVTMNAFLKTIMPKENHSSPAPCEDMLADFGLEKPFFARFLNEGFSGGEKKKSEMLQFLARRPRFAIFDEIDAGLDVDSLHAISEVMKKATENGTGILLISHSPRLFERLRPVSAHVLMRGALAASGGPEIISIIEQHGYARFGEKK